MAPARGHARSVTGQAGVGAPLLPLVDLEVGAPAACTTALYQQYMPADLEHASMVGCALQQQAHSARHFLARQRG